MNLFLDPLVPASIHLKISPLVAALTGLQYADDPPPDWQALACGSPLVHLTPYCPPSTACPPGAAGPPGPPSRHVRRRRGGWPRMILIPHHHVPLHALPPALRREPEPPPPAEPDEAWSRLRGLLETDLRYRMRRLTQGGLVELFADLSPWLDFDGKVLLVNTRCDTEAKSHANRLILMPTLLVNRIVLLTPQPPKPVVLLYPARGSSAGIPKTELDHLVGGYRLPLLKDLREPRTLDELVSRHGLDPQSVRRQLDALAGAGLLTVHRAPTERYECTHVASALVAPRCTFCG